MKIIRRILQFLFGKTLYVVTNDGCFTKMKRVRKIVYHAERVYLCHPDGLNTRLYQERTRIMFKGLFGLRGWIWADEMAAISDSSPPVAIV